MVVSQFCECYKDCWATWLPRMVASKRMQEKSNMGKNYAMSSPHHRLARFFIEKEDSCAGVAGFEGDIGYERSN